MANQTSNQRNKTGNSRGGGNQGQQRAAAGSASATEQSSGQFGSIGEMASQASDYLAESASDAQECIREHSGTSVVVSLVAGFGIGLLIGRAIGASHQEPRSWRDRVTAEGFGRRLIDRIESMIPEALAEQFGK